MPFPIGFEIDGDELDGRNWLEVGCGTGRIGLYAAELGAQLTAVDQTAAYVEILATKYARLPYQYGYKPIKQPTLIAGSVESLPQDVRGQDVVTAMFGVLNHCEDWRAVISDLAGRMNEGGTFVATMYGSPNAAVYQEIQAGLPYAPAILTRRAEGGLLLGEDADQVLPAQFPYPADVEQTLAEAGLRVECMVPLIGVTAFYPRDFNLENVAAFIEVIERRYGTLVADNLRRSNDTPESLLMASLLADAEIPRDKINEAAYFGVVATKVETENA